MVAHEYMELCSIITITHRPMSRVVIGREIE